MNRARQRRRIPVPSALVFVFLLVQAVYGQAQPVPSGFGEMPRTTVPELLCFIGASATLLGWFAVTIRNARKPDGRDRK